MTIVYLIKNCVNGEEFEVGVEDLIGPGPIYSFSGSNGVVICGYVVSQPDPQPETYNYTGITSYGECFDCIPPRSANTENNLCLEVCSGGTRTVVQVSPPHPVWTDSYGTQVTQLNAITLGGQNGLNN